MVSVKVRQTKANPLALQQSFTLQREYNVDGVLVQIYSAQVGKEYWHTNKDGVKDAWYRGVITVGDELVIGVLDTERDFNHIHKGRN